MKIYKLHNVGFASRDEYVFDCGTLYAPFKYGIRIDVSDNIQYLEDYVYIPDEIIECHVKYVISNKKYIMRQSVEIDWEKLKWSFDHNTNLYYIVYIINDNMVAFSNNLIEKNDILSIDSIDYKTWIIKRLIE